MKEGEVIINAYSAQAEIERIIAPLKQYTFKDLKKRPHYYFSLAEKGTDEKELEDYFSQFDKIKLVLYRERKNGYNSYDFHYEKGDKEYFLYSIHLGANPPELINAFKISRSLKRFIAYLRRYYGKKIS